VPGYGSAVPHTATSAPESSADLFDVPSIWREDVVLSLTLSGEERCAGASTSVAMPQLVAGLVSLLDEMEADTVVDIGGGLGPLSAWLRSVCSIFIASTIATACPAATVSPTATSTAITVPGIGLRTTPSSAPPGPSVLPRCTTGSSSQAHPPSATDRTLPRRTSDTMVATPSTSSVPNWCGAGSTLLIMRSGSPSDRTCHAPAVAVGVTDTAMRS
jgi:hypothetical protein